MYYWFILVELEVNSGDTNRIVFGWGGSGRETITVGWDS